MRLFHSQSLTHVEELSRTVDTELGVLEDQGDVHLSRPRTDRGLHCYGIWAENLPEEGERRERMSGGVVAFSQLTLFHCFHNAC